MLCLFAGHKEGFMEEYSVARLNTSMIGHNVLDVDDSASTSENEDDSIFDKITGKVDDVKNDIKGKINDITGDIADELADTIGISEWYSIHIMATCDGQYKPNATSPGAGFNVTNCTNSAPESKCNNAKVITITNTY
jgi:hypothetical protein